MSPSKAIDWHQVRARLDRAVAATEEALHPSPEQARTVLDERARLLARVPPLVLGASETLEVVTFTLGDEFYALETQHVSEVIRVGDITPVPGAPSFLAGVINLRGEIVAVVDLRPLLGLGPRAVTDLSRILVLGDERIEFALLVDSTQEVLRLRYDSILEPPGELAGTARPYLRGVTVDALIVLDGLALLRDQRLFIELDS